MGYSTGPGGYQGGGASIVSVIAGLVGQAISALRYTATAPTSTDAFIVANNGARVHFGAGANDFASSDGTTVTFAGPTTTAGVVNANAGLNISGAALLVGGSQSLNFYGGSTITWQNNAAQGAFSTSINSTNAGTAPNTSAFGFYPTTVLDPTDWLVSFSTQNQAANMFAVTYAGSIVLPTTDSTGTPGNATINQATGRSSIAAAAASCVITNSLVTTASRVFISPKARDTLGLLPTVTAQTNGSFTVTTSANCSSALPFDWWVLG